MYPVGLGNTRILINSPPPQDIASGCQLHDMEALHK